AGRGRGGTVEGGKSLLHTGIREAGDHLTCRGIVHLERGGLVLGSFEPRPGAGGTSGGHRAPTSVGSCWIRLRSPVQAAASSRSASAVVRGIGLFSARRAARGPSAAAQLNRSCPTPISARLRGMPTLPRNCATIDGAAAANSASVELGGRGKIGRAHV